MGSRFHEKTSRKGKKETKLGAGMCSAEMNEMEDPIFVFIEMSVRWS
jgi:hypothetical protein